MEPEAFSSLLLQQTWETGDSKKKWEGIQRPRRSDCRWKVPAPVLVKERAFLSWCLDSEKKFPCVPGGRQHW